MNKKNSQIVKMCNISYNVFGELMALTCKYREGNIKNKHRKGEILYKFLFFVLEISKIKL